ncbi:DUF2764 family protein [Blastopirellula sp. JC732]|uniref:DUF2764 family protein n=1 Tax=Blastopirellula sediminis TaxID=2894196 RepID=A0A9X1MLB4_9BACT|nr:DUF2764 family protein [Blastopirellula sediminis]MCC9608285.1 DUF2764 family protein [Blastopirellula sediminis]MCC9628956.1 DUF2764 family protein [Blastopirellula sediminis]
MYYDLVSSLPYLPYFQEADRLPITPLRLEQRLRLLKPRYAEQLFLVRPLVSWRMERQEMPTDDQLRAQRSQLAELSLDRDLREYVNFRMTQRWLVAVLRYRQAELELPTSLESWNVDVNIRRLQRHWTEPGLGLVHVHKWLPQAENSLSTLDSLGLERLLIDLNWTWLTRCADQGMFRFAAVFAYVFKWDMLQTWLRNDPNAAKARFTQLVDEVTHVAES